MDSDNITKNDLINDDLDKLLKFVSVGSFVAPNKDEIRNLIIEIKKENYVNLLKNNLKNIGIIINSKEDVKDKFFNKSKYEEFIQNIDNYNLDELNTIVFCGKRSMQLFWNDKEALDDTRKSWMTLKPKLDLRIGNPIRQKHELRIFREPNELYKHYLGENMDDITRLQNLRSSINEQMQGGRRNNNRKSNRKQNRKSNRKQNRKSNRKSNRKNRRN